MQAARAAGRPLHLGGNLWWADRGSTWTWAGRRCGAVGGAVSPDRWMHDVAPWRWADDEAPNRDDVDRLRRNADDDLDVLFCHDAPAGIRGLRSGLDYRPPADIEAQARDVQRLLKRAIEHTAPSLVFHGHWHQPNREHIVASPTDVVGLAEDGRPGSAAVLDLATLTATMSPSNLRGDTHRQRIR